MVSRLELPSHVTGLTVLDDFDDISAALRSPNVLSGWDRTPPYGIPDFFRGHISDLNGPPHFERRRIESPVVRNAALAMIERYDVGPTLEEYVDRWFANRDREGTVRADLAKDALNILLRVAARVIGIDGVESDARQMQLLNHVDLGGKMVTSTFSRLGVEEQSELVKSAELSQREYVADFLEPSVRRRAGLVREVKSGDRQMGDLPSDIITMLLGHWDGNWVDQLGAFAAETLFFLTGASRTSMRAVCNTLVDLFRWFEGHPEDKDLVQDNDFLHAAIQESLRLHAVLPFLYRTTIAEVTLPSGLVLPAGARFILSHGEANRSERIFGPDANSFDPRRVLPGRINGYGLSFGGGAHTCFGRRVAMGADGTSRGTIATLVSRLFELGVQLDPLNPLAPVTDTYYEEYLHFPVILMSR
jgi:cytochrome P450